MWFLKFSIILPNSKLFISLYKFVSNSLFACFQNSVLILMAPTAPSRTQEPDAPFSGTCPVSDKTSSSCDVMNYVLFFVLQRKDQLLAFQKVQLQIFHHSFLITRHLIFSNYFFSQPPADDCCVTCGVLPVTPSPPPRSN